MQYPCPTPEGDGITLSIVVHRSFAEALGLEIIEEDTGAAAEPASILSDIPDAAILAEAIRRGFIPKPD